jgi:formylglycine-generating enzyme required for sulfatase activity
MRRITTPFILSLLSVSAGATVTIDWANIGNAGSGDVAYEYRIAKNETTIGQYTEFLNAVAKTDPFALYNEAMTTGRIAGIARTGTSGNFTYSVIGNSARKPVTFVSWFDAARFCNWLHNGQGSSGTENGAYTLNGAVSGTIMDFPLNKEAQVWIPTGSQWYKAAAYDPTKGATGGFWPYATRIDTMPSNTIGVAGSANIFLGQYFTQPATALTEVGAFGSNSASFYGTNDQCGNVQEWIEDMALPLFSRTVRGGSWRDGPWQPGGVLATASLMAHHEMETDDIGFRIASGPDVAIIVLEQSDGKVIDNSSEIAAFSRVRPVKSWIMKNKGYKSLTGLNSLLTGQDKADFMIEKPIPPVLNPNESCEIRIGYSTASEGRRSAVFTLYSSEPSKPEVQIGLEGYDPSATDAWRFSNFGSPENEGQGADSADPDRDGMVNMIEFAFGTDPKLPTEDQAEIVKNGSVLEYRYWRSKLAASELTFVREFAAAPSGPWQQTGGSAETILSDDGVRQRVLVTTPASSAIERRFVRMRITRR